MVKLDLLKAEEAEKAQVVQEAHEEIEGGARAPDCSWKRLSDFKNAQVVKPNPFYQLRWLKFRIKKEKLEAEFTTFNLIKVSWGEFPIWRSSLQWIQLFYKAADILNGYPFKQSTTFQ